MIQTVGNGDQSSQPMSLVASHPSIVIMPVQPTSVPDNWNTSQCLYTINSVSDCYHTSDSAAINRLLIAATVFLTPTTLVQCHLCLPPVLNLV